MPLSPGPRGDGAAGVGRRQDAGVGGGEGSPAVSSGENLQVVARAFYQVHFGERTTVQRMECADLTYKGGDQ